MHIYEATCPACEKPHQYFSLEEYKFITPICCGEETNRVVDKGKYDINTQYEIHAEYF